MCEMYSSGVAAGDGSGVCWFVLRYSTVAWTSPEDPDEVAIKTPCGDVGEAALCPRSTMDLFYFLRQSLT